VVLALERMTRSEEGMVRSREGVSRSEEGMAPVVERVTGSGEGMVLALEGMIRSRNSKGSRNSGVRTEWHLSGSYSLGGQGFAQFAPWFVH